MSRLLDAIRQQADTRPDAIAIDNGERQLSYRSLLNAVEALQAALAPRQPHCLALLADNGIAWASADLAALALQRPLVPLPAFFSPQQMRHAIAQAGVDCLLSDRPLPPALQEALAMQALDEIAPGLFAYRCQPSDHACELPAGICKVTFTSGSTGAPKGVFLDEAAIEAVVSSLCAASEARPGDRHVSVLPLPTLLENIAGLYVPLVSGATCVLPPLARTGLNGSSALDVRQQLDSLHQLRATTTILVPFMLAMQTAALEAGMPPPATLRFVAVGGGSVPPHLLARATEAGLPVFEGYGLSECASVVTLNQMYDNRIGSVGKPLPHVAVRIADDGEILVCMPGIRGYLDKEPAFLPRWLPTGDLGRFDADGFLHITGRKKNLFITAFGRNVSPEWIELALLDQPGIQQAFVCGEARPFNVALIFADTGMSDADLDCAVACADAGLPDYARITRWLRLSAPFSLRDGLLTSNGRPRRAAIQSHYAKQIDMLYEESPHGILC